MRNKLNLIKNSSYDRLVFPYVLNALSDSSSFEDLSLEVGTDLCVLFMIVESFRTDIKESKLSSERLSGDTLIETRSRDLKSPHETRS